MIQVKECNIEWDDLPPLYHVTHKRNVPGILARGLVPQVGALTRAALKKSRPEGVWVFATEYNYLRDAIDMVAGDPDAGIGMGNVAVLGITAKCANLFGGEGYTEIDYTSEQPVPPKCLCQMPDGWWQKVYRQQEDRLV